MSKEEFDDIVRFVAQEKHVKNPEVFDEAIKNVMRYWSAVDDNDSEGIFLNWYTNEAMPYLPWGPNRPYRDLTAYNYIQTKIKLAIQNNSHPTIESAKIYDEDKSYSASTVCTVQSRSLRFKLRGLCSDFSYDRDYMYTVEEDGLEVFKGKTNSLLRYNSTAKLWHLYKFANTFEPSDNSSFLTSTASRESLMIGLHQLDFDQHLEEKCFKGKKLQLIKLTSCAAGMFTCNDGSCIPIEKRCDQIAQCKDKSDESKCKLIVMENYNKNIPPFTVNPTTDEITAVSVNISANVIDILKINEVEQAFEVKISLLLTWYDNRLVYHNLKESRMANSPTMKEVEKLWIPRIIFDNTRNKLGLSWAKLSSS